MLLIPPVDKDDTDDCVDGCTTSVDDAVRADVGVLKAGNELFCGSGGRAGTAAGAAAAGVAAAMTRSTVAESKFIVNRYDY